MTCAFASADDLFDHLRLWWTLTASLALPCFFAFVINCVLPNHFVAIAVSFTKKKLIFVLPPFVCVYQKNLVVKNFFFIYCRACSFLESLCIINLGLAPLFVCGEPYACACEQRPTGPQRNNWQHFSGHWFAGISVHVTELLTCATYFP